MSMTAVKMGEVDRALAEIEALLVGSTAPRFKVLRELHSASWMPILFLLLGFKLQFRQATIWASFVFLTMLLLFLAWPESLTQPGHPLESVSFSGVFIGLVALSTLVAIFSIPSRTSTYLLNDELLLGTREILAGVGLSENDRARSILIRSVEQTTNSRSRNWLSVAALLWGMYLFSLGRIEQQELYSSFDELTILLFSTLFIWLIASAYLSASRKLVQLLQFADAGILDARNQKKLTTH